MLQVGEFFCFVLTRAHFYEPENRGNGQHIVSFDIRADLADIPDNRHRQVLTILAVSRVIVHALPLGTTEPRRCGIAVVLFVPGGLDR